MKIPGRLSDFTRAAKVTLTPGRGRVWKGSARMLTDARKGAPFVNGRSGTKGV
ncbi:MAG TPA: hypothetical protein VF508_12055 [Pyrinomonadaceae bacterium]